MYGLIIVPQKSEKKLYFFFSACFVYKYRGGSNTKSIQNTQLMKLAKMINVFYPTGMVFSPFSLVNTENNFASMNSYLL